MRKIVWLGAVCCAVLPLAAIAADRVEYPRRAEQDHTEEHPLAGDTERADVAHAGTLELPEAVGIELVSEELDLKVRLALDWPGETAHIQRQVATVSS